MKLAVRERPGTPELSDGDDDPPSIELAVEKERVLNALDQTLAKLELAVVTSDNMGNWSNIREACLPLLAAGDGAELQPLLSCEQLQQVLAAAAAARAWPPRGPRGHAQGHAAPRHDPALARAAAILLASPGVAALKDRLLPQMSPAAGRLLGLARALRADTAAALAVSPMQQRRREWRLRRAWLRDQKALRDKESLERALDRQRSELGSQLAGKSLLANSHRTRLDRLRRQAADDARTIVDDCEINMSSTTRESEERQEILRSDIETLQARLDKFLAAHLAQEKELQLRRLKMEAQLAGWLQNYDADVSERQAELEEVAAAYEGEKQQMEELQEALEKQTLEYERLMAEKEEHDRLELEATIERILTNRAARCIQRGWREYRERKTQRRKGRKKKKGSGKRKKRKPSAKKK